MYVITIIYISLRDRHTSENHGFSVEGEDCFLPLSFLPFLSMATPKGTAVLAGSAGEGFGLISRPLFVFFNIARPKDGFCECAHERVAVSVRMRGLSGVMVAASVRMRGLSGVTVAASVRVRGLLRVCA